MFVRAVSFFVLMRDGGGDSRAGRLAERGLGRRGLGLMGWTLESVLE